MRQTDRLSRSQAYKTLVEQMAGDRPPGNINVRDVVSAAGKGMIQLRKDVEKYRVEELKLPAGLHTRVNRDAIR